MKLRSGRLVTLLAAAGSASLLFWILRDPDPLGTAAVRLDAGSEIPEIGLSRLAEPGLAPSAPVRDVFQFGRGKDVDPVPTPVIRLPPTPPPVETPEPPPTPTPWPTLNVSFIGIVDNGAGRKVGSFVKDGDILLVGEAGQVLGNAFRVVRIGAESAEIEELGSGRTRRIPLRTNPS